MNRVAAEVFRQCMARRPIPGDIENGFRLLVERLLTAPRLIVAFSGGVDSSALLAAAVHVLGDGVTAVTGVSPSLSAAQKQQAVDVATSLGARHLLLDTNELEDENYAANPHNRCFFCKTELYGRLRELYAEPTFVIADGTNADDAKEPRPGMLAAERHGVISPLKDAGFSKANVRALSRAFGLVTAELPASPCLASRLPYGSRVTIESLAMIERAEEAIRALGFREFRVRHFGAMARLEVAAAERPRLDDSSLRAAACAAIKAAGFEAAAIDPRPLRSGRLNEVSANEG